MFSSFCFFGERMRLHIIVMMPLAQFCEKFAPFRFALEYLTCFFW